MKVCAPDSYFNRFYRPWENVFPVITHSNNVMVFNKMCTFNNVKICSSLWWVGVALSLQAPPSSRRLQVIRITGTEPVGLLGSIQAFTCFCFTFMFLLPSWSCSYFGFSQEACFFNLSSPGPSSELCTLIFNKKVSLRLISPSQSFSCLAFNCCALHSPGLPIYRIKAAQQKLYWLYLLILAISVLAVEFFNISQVSLSEPLKTQVFILYAFLILPAIWN